MRFVKGLRDRLEYAVLRAGQAAALSVTPRAAEPILRAAAVAYFRLDGRRRRTTLENLRVAFGDELSPEARRALAVRAVENAFRTAYEIAVAPRFLRSLRSLRERISLTGDDDLMFADARAGRAAVVLSAHLGNWEIFASRLQRERIPLSVVVRPVENPLLDEWAARVRGGRASVIEKRGAVRDGLRSLRKGTWVGLLADQNAGRHGVFVPFFGLPASTSPIAAILAVRAGVPVYFGVNRRVGRGMRFELRLHRHETDPSADHRTETRRLLDAYAAHVEAWAREWPEQYMWLHRRWKTRPLDEAPGPHIPVYDRRKRLVRERLKRRRAAQPTAA